MYEIIDEYGEVFGQYKEQEGLLRTVYYMYRIPNPASVGKYSLVYIDEDEAMTMLGYIGEQVFKDWAADMENTVLDLRLVASTDILGLEEYIENQGHAVSYATCDCPVTTICPIRYGAWIDHDMHGTGYTRIEALAKAYVRKVKRDGIDT